MPAFSFAIELFPIPVKKEILVKSSEQRKLNFKKLDDADRKLAYHLFRVARLGRPLLLDQSHRFAWDIHQLFTKALNSKNWNKTEKLLSSEGFAEFLNYALLFEDQNGPYVPSNRKYILSKVSEKELLLLLKKYHSTQNNEAIAAFMTDPKIEVLQRPEDDSQDLTTVGGNLYQKGITSLELKAAHAKGLQVSLNGQVVKNKKGELSISLYAANNPALAPHLRKALQAMVKEMRECVKLAKTEHQKAQFQSMEEYFETGNNDAFRKFNIDWVKDGTDSHLDFMAGFVETYGDFRNSIAFWESYLSVVDPKMTAVSKNLAKAAQYFEDRLPYGKFKKKFPVNYSPPAMMVNILDEQSDLHILGFNLPNFDDIRRDVGAKNLISLDVNGAEKDEATKVKMTEVLTSFLNPDRVEATRQDWGNSIQEMVLFHEIIGHGSGTYDQSKYAKEEDPTSALGALGSALEEERADLTSLVFANDPQLVKIGYYPDQAAADRIRMSAYDMYVTRFFMRVAKDRNLSEAHAHGQQVFFNRLLKAGAIELKPRNAEGANKDDQIIFVKDYDLYQKEAVRLLEELQRIKATRDVEALKKLFATDGELSDIEKPWMQNLMKRAEKLRYFIPTVVQPWTLTPKGEFKIIGDLSLKSVAQAGFVAE